MKRNGQSVQGTQLLWHEGSKVSERDRKKDRVAGAEGLWLGAGER